MQTTGLNDASCCGTSVLGQPFHMDTPMRRGSAGQTPYTRLLGHAINNPGLASIKVEDKSSVVMTRANNVASLTAAMLLKIKPEKRQVAMEEIAGVNYTNDILAFARNYPGGLGVSDAIRFSLAMHFLVGILDSEAKRSTKYADGYLAYARVFKSAQDRRNGKLSGLAGTTSSSGLGGLAGHKVWAGEDWTKGNETQAQATARARARAASWDDWCYANAGQTYDPALVMKCSNPPIGCDTKHPDSGEGRTCRGLVNGWVKPVARPAAGYPAPPDIAAIRMNLIQADACGVVTQSIAQKRNNKLIGIHMTFTIVFGRAPNNAEKEYYGGMRWCGDERGASEALKNKMIGVRDQIIAGRLSNTTPDPDNLPAGVPTDGTYAVPVPGDWDLRTFGSDVSEGLQKAAEAAFDFLGKTADFIADIMCRGFKAIFGPVVGGVICDILTFLTRMMVSGIAAIIDIVVESLKGTFEFIKLMIAGKVEAAFEALLKMLGRVLFSLSAPMMVPILMADKGQGRSMAQAFAELKVRADRVMKKEPLWPLMVIMAVVGIFSAIGGNVLGAITGVITALAPMAATFISEPLKANIIELKNETLENIEAGIGKFIKFALLIFNGAMAIKDIVAKFRGQLAKYMSNQSAGSLTGGAKASGTERIKYVLEKFSAGVNAITAAFKNFNVKDIAASAGPLLMLIPDLLMAILPDDAAESMPTLTEWRDSVKKSIKSTNEAEATLRAGAADLFKTFTLDAKVAHINESIADPSIKIAEAASITAKAYATQFKNKTTYPQFAAAFRAELIKA